MTIYVAWAIFGFLFIFIELLMPMMFFLNLSAAAFLTAVFSYYSPTDYITQIILFCVLSLLLVVFMRPYMLQKQEKANATGIVDKYIGKKALVSKTIGAIGTDGVGQIKIYDEVWQAKDIDMGEILAFSMVKIVRLDGLIMFVRKIEEKETKPKEEETGETQEAPDNIETGESKGE